MRRIVISILTGSLFLLTGCGDNLPEGDLVDNGQAFEMETVAEDLQAGSFPFQKEMKDLQDGQQDSPETAGSRREFKTLSQLRGEVKELLGERYWPEVPISGEELARRVGITKDMYVDYLAEKQVLDSHIDMFIIVHAKEEAVGRVEQAIENYRNTVIRENKDYPQNLGKAEASRMETIEDYICFVQLGGDTTVVAERGIDAVINYCLEENERALYVLEQAILQ